MNPVIPAGVIVNPVRQPVSYSPRHSQFTLTMAVPSYPTLAAAALVLAFTALPAHAGEEHSQVTIDIASFV